LSKVFFLEVNSVTGRANIRQIDLPGLRLILKNICLTEPFPTTSRRLVQTNTDFGPVSYTVDTGAHFSAIQVAWGTTCNLSIYCQRLRKTGAKPPQKRKTQNGQW
jgi:hypothetical protein